MGNNTTKSPINQKKEEKKKFQSLPCFSIVLPEKKKGEGGKGKEREEKDLAATWDAFDKRSREAPSHEF